MNFSNFFRYAIKKRFDICPYSERRGVGNWAFASDRPKLGSLKIIEKNNARVVCLFSQFSYGTIKKYQDVIIDRHILDGYDQGVVETEEIREMAFKKCLNEMDRLIPQEANIYFPEMIGCRLAGGNWDNYKKMIEKFAENRNVIIVQQIIWH